MTVTINEASHIVKEFSIGNTRVKISDEFCKDKTAEDVDKILRSIARNAIEHFSSVAVDK